MGLLAGGTPLVWEEGRKYADHVRQHGVTQFLNSWDRNEDRDGDEETWGDELECMVIAFDHEKKNAMLSLRQMEILDKLQDVEVDENLPEDDPARPQFTPLFDPEYGSYMIENSPGGPYTEGPTELLRVEANLRYRRKLTQKHMKPNEVLISLASFPRLGAPGVYSSPQYEPGGTSSQSLFLPDEITNLHPRFQSLTDNFRRRRGRKVAINVPIFFDEKTPKPFVDPTIPWDRDLFPGDAEAKNGAALQDHIYMDATGFGAGCCCVQMTLQTRNLTEARRLYDALIPIAPIMLALSAASPAYRGYLADVDCRWNVIRDAADDRTEEEIGLKPLKESKYRIPKSRYDSADSYISGEPSNKPEYSDIPLPMDEDIYKRLRDHGLDEPLSKHMAHLFIRDPLVILSESLEQDDETSMGHFENLQSTNWQTLRFKSPPQDGSSGWRVEFRSTEAQITDFENAAFAIFVVLLSRAILRFGLEFYMPISKVDENMQKAQKRDAVRRERFFFRKAVVLREAVNGFHHGQVGTSAPGTGNVEEEYELMTLNEIVNGTDGGSPGLLGFVNAYIKSLKLDASIERRLEKYLDLIKGRADGSLMTSAAWMRRFIRSHPAYKFDSVISEEVNYDLMKALDEVERGVRREPDLLPDWYRGAEEVQPDLKPTAIIHN